MTQLSLDHAERLAVRVLRGQGFFVGRMFAPVSRPQGSAWGLEVEEVGVLAHRDVDGRTFRAGSFYALAAKAIGAPIMFPIQLESDGPAIEELAA